jgi:hypothetical protein
MRDLKILDWLPNSVSIEENCSQDMDHSACKLLPTVDSVYILISRVARDIAHAVSPGFSPQRPGSTPRAVHVGFVVERVALGQVFTNTFGLPLLVS